jgi:hypothetical protein
MTIKIPAEKAKQLVHDLHDAIGTLVGNIPGDYDSKTSDILRVASVMIDLTEQLLCVKIINEANNEQ